MSEPGQPQIESHYSFGDFLRAVYRGDRERLVEVYLVDEVPSPAPLTEDELATMEAWADRC
jgi:hypothetical protein